MKTNYAKIDNFYSVFHEGRFIFKQYFLPNALCGKNSATCIIYDTNNLNDHNQKSDLIDKTLVNLYVFKETI